MLVGKTQLTIDGTRMVKIVCLLVWYTIGFMGCNKDTLKTSHSTSGMSAKTIMPVDWFVWFQVLKLIGRLFPDSGWLACSLSRELSRISRSHLHWISEIRIPIRTIRIAFYGFKRNSIRLRIYKFKFNLNRTITKR